MTAGSPDEYYQIIIRKLRLAHWPECPPLPTTQVRPLSLQHSVGTTLTTVAGGMKWTHPSDK